MPFFSKESLDALRQRVDLVEVLSSHIDLHRSGASYKGLCPFHDEKTPSFMIQKGDTHYHCFGCGAHGDSIQFLMAHLKINFAEAIEILAQKFNIPLQHVEAENEPKGPNKAALKNALEVASRLFHLLLLHTKEGHVALEYLFKRGIDLDFVYRFRLGLAPKEPGVLRAVLHAKSISDDLMGEAGLISPGKEKGWRDFFQDRITFPIYDAAGAVIGFSARKYKEETFGGKYINTPETPVFKKSRVLFGLNHCRKRIAKERKAIVVEGQIDALRLIAEGFNITVAGQGTAFGEEHVRELVSLGINEVYLAMDSDHAGEQATCKIGDLFQREGIEVRVLKLPQGNDPDAFLRENGPMAFLDLMYKSISFIPFLVLTHSQRLDVDSPAGKNELVQTLTKQIRAWNHPLMVHESLRKLAQLIKIPEQMLGVGENHLPNIYIKNFGSLGVQTINPDRILEADFLRWLIVSGQHQPKYLDLAKMHLKIEQLKESVCRTLYHACLLCQDQQGKIDLLFIASHLEDEEGQAFLSELLQKKVNLERAEEHLLETIQKILDRNWMNEREQVKRRIQSAECTEEEILELVKQFDALKRPIERIKNQV